MKQLFKLKILLLVPCFIVWNACKDYEAKDCALSICSEQFNTVYMTVVTLSDAGEDAGLQEGKKKEHPLALDDFRVINKLNQSPVKLNFSADDFLTMQKNGRYLVCDDSFVPGRENTQVVLEFIGILKNKEVISGELTVEIDCCHVVFFSGSQKLILK